MLRPSIFGENLFDDWMDDFPFGKDFERAMFPGKNPLYGKHAKNMMKTDVRETESEYEVDIDLPGFKKDEISLDVKDGYLTISAEKGLDKNEEDKKGRVLRQERYAGVCTRSFYVGDVTPEDVKAKYKSGVLTIVLPKKEQKKLDTTSKIAIE